MNWHRGIIFLSCLMIAGCGLFDRAPDSKAIYEALKNVSSQPFNIEAVACTQRDASYACSFDATIIAGSVAGPVGDRRPDYRRVRMSGLFSRRGEGWNAGDVQILPDGPTTP